MTLHDEVKQALEELIDGADDYWRSQPVGQDTIARANNLIARLTATPKCDDAEWMRRISEAKVVGGFFERYFFPDESRAALHRIADTLESSAHREAELREACEAVNKHFYLAHWLSVDQMNALNQVTDAIRPDTESK